MNATKKMATYIREKGISIKAISRATNLPVGPLYVSFRVNSEGRVRPLRVDEFLEICAFLNVDPFEFRVVDNKLQDC